MQLVLMAVSHETENLNLHKKLLVDQIWMSQHNRSRHASPHARFVRPSCRGLFPKGKHAPSTLILTAVCLPQHIDLAQSQQDLQRSHTSATSEVQLVLYVRHFTSDWEPTDPCAATVSSLGQLQESELAGWCYGEARQARSCASCRSRCCRRKVHGEKANLAVSNLKPANSLPKDTGPIRLSQST